MFCVVKTIVLTHSAAKAFDKLPTDARDQIADALHLYAASGRGDAKSMAGTPTVRLRSGNFRVIFDESAAEIVVLALGHRREIYR